MKFQVDTDPPRYLAVWIPNWPLHALIHEQQEARADRADTAGGAADGELVSAATPFALTAHNRVVAASPTAQQQGVDQGIRVATAQALCPELQLFPHSVTRDVTQFDRVMRALADCIPDMEMVEPGLMVVPSRGPSRFYGSESDAAHTVRSRLEQLGYLAQIAVANGKFASCQAALASTAQHTGRIGVVAQGGSKEFLAAFPIHAVADTQLAQLLTAMGVHTLGAFTKLSQQAVRERCGDAGLIAWHHAHGHDVVVHGTHSTATQKLTEAALFDARVRAEHTGEMHFEPAVTTAEELAFACATTAEALVVQLAESHLVCTTLRIVLTDDTGETFAQSWPHPNFFTATDVLGRLRWQAASAAQPAQLNADSELPQWNGFVRVQFIVEHWDWARQHRPQLWSGTAGDQLHHQLSRLQSNLGYSSVVTPALTGGRLLHERFTAVPWGSAPARAHTDAALPWPGHLPAPRPTEVFAPPCEARLTTADTRTVHIDEHDLLSGTPAVLTVPHRFTAPQTVTHWSAPWPIRERWWEGVPATHRLQLTLEDGSAWLLLHRNRTWYAEGRYD